MMPPPAPPVRILVTGTGGRLGQLLRRAWQFDPPEGVQVTLQSSSAPADLVWSSGDPMERLPECDTLIALWGRTSGGAEALQINSDLARLSRRVALASRAQRVLHFSSAAIYGPGIRMDEATSPNPVTDYGAAKLAMEKVIGAFPSAEGITHTCLRVANVAGADSLAPALTGQHPLVLDRFSDGRGPRRSYIAPGDLARVLVRLAALPPAALPPILNIAAPEPVAMEALAHAAEVAVTWRDAPTQAVPEVSLDASLLTRLSSGLKLNTTPDSIAKDFMHLRV